MRSYRDELKKNKITTEYYEINIRFNITYTDYLIKFLEKRIIKELVSGQLRTNGLKEN